MFTVFKLVIPTAMSDLVGVGHSNIINPQAIKMDIIPH